MPDDVLLELRGTGVPQRLHPLDARCYRGELLHIIGPNGSGKSTLLAVMAGLLMPHGDVLLQGQSLPALSAGVLAEMRAYLPQQYPVLARMPAFQYLQQHQPMAADETAVDDAVSHIARSLSLTDKLHRPLTQLSGGEWQRVRLAALLLQVWPSLNPQARLLLLDEPTTGLDIAQRVALDTLLAGLCLAGITVVASSHDLNHTLHHADRVWLMSKGALAAQGTAQDVMQPERLAPVFEVGFQQYVLDGRYWMMAVGD
ncbi:vitamin B12 ABC transporter ATP-binding protein BtuD [Musicola keenii]|uniref:vitamin B12 ABC transporter ATP-binding protein BtuD n=1 Tax=Musicola keenii TaxID=2884250 RepID=UPI00177BB0E3|nr:vitamin B12 ABC transporter ATP-binding protein BtuD [Musicola keenii]